MIAQLDRPYLATSSRNIYQRLVSYLFFEGRPLTTRGRWLNPLVFSLLNYLKDRGNKEIRRPVFIVGIGRSGTTLLGRILSSHREVGYLNEPKALWHTVFPGEDLNGNYSTGPARYIMDDRDATPLQRTQIHTIYHYYLKLAGASRLVDKYPELVFRTSLIKYLFPDARLLFLVRNGNDILQSIKQWSKSRGIIAGDRHEDWWGLNNRKWRLLVDQIVTPGKEWTAIRDQVAAFTSHIDMAAVEWIAAMRAGMKAETSCPGMIRRIYYEDLVNSPEKTLKSVTDFAELPEDQTMIDYALSVISPGPAKEWPLINKALLPLFRDTMLRLGYTE